LKKVSETLRLGFFDTKFASWNKRICELFITVGVLFVESPFI
ncbi:20773_t:CDS:1, partial [Gigaspora margarita]